MAKSPVFDWVTDPNTAFLLGAGCSRCAGKPLMSDLTKGVLDALGATVRKVYSQLRGQEGSDPTIEDLLNYLLNLQRLLATRRDGKIEGWTADTVATTIQAILREIVRQIGKDRQPSEVHGRFLRRLASHSGRPACDIFTTNYDLVLEATLEDETLPYADGFRGADNAYFDPSTYDASLNGAVLFRLYKLHGSVSWTKDPKGVVRRRHPEKIEEAERLLIYPSEEKSTQARYGIYDALLDRFRSRLRADLPNNKLVILGYSLNDSHIVDVILDALNRPGNNLTVYALVGPEQNVQAQIERLEQLWKQAPERMNIMVGREKFIGHGLTETEWEDVREMDLWRFENLVNALTGGTP